MTTMTVATKDGGRHQQSMTVMTPVARLGSRHTLAMTVMTVANYRLIYDARGTTEARRRHVYRATMLHKVCLTV